MKHPVIRFAAFLLLVFTLANCKKIEQIQLEDQVLGHWVSSSVQSDSVDVTGFYSFDLSLLQAQKFELTVKTKNLLTGKTDTQTATGTFIADNLQQSLQLLYTDASINQSYDVKYVDDIRMLLETLQDGKLTKITLDKK
ncbi:MAG: hypothetical protein IT260_11945 [Saprospiraceae bacterium]|nr:hypothetical protein [Saprospiraceae bacterium]